MSRPALGFGNPGMNEESTNGPSWDRVRGILEEALELPPAAREDFIERATEGDSALGREVRTYLSAAGGDGLLDRHIDEVVADMVPDPGPAPHAPGGRPSAGEGAPPGEDSEWIGPYRLHEILGEGGMGTVYRAVQTEPVRREVALKVIKPGMDSDEVRARFESERQALAVMDHSSIAKVLDAGSTDGGRAYFVMELVRGVPIGEYCDAHRLGTRDRIELFVQVAEAVQHAHQKGVIHRDLKPSNVLVSVQDAKPIAKVIDFGISKSSGQRDDASMVTSIGQVLGTPAYMSPEQAEGSGLDVDTRTDVYALGVMLYELLSGNLPFDRELFRKPDFVVRFLMQERPVPTPSARLSSLSDTQDTVARLRHTDVRTLRRELRGDLDWIVMRAMERDRTRRYATASELVADLRRFLEGVPVEARPPSAAYRMRKFARRHRMGLGAAALVAVSMIGGTVASTIAFVRAERAREDASAAAERSAAVSGFLDRMLRAADPVRGGTSETTVREVLDAASEEVEGGALADQPLVETDVRRSIGGTYLMLGLYEPARTHLEQALELLTEAGGEWRDVIFLHDELGQLDRRDARPTEAVARYERALTLADSLGMSTDGGDGETLTNRVRNDLGIALRDLDRIDEAAAVLESLAESERRLLDSDDLQLATTLNNLALVKRAQGETGQAISLFHETLGVLRGAFGEQHVYVAAVLESIGSLEQLQNRLDVADSLMTLAHEMRLELLGPQHPDIVNGLNGLALLQLNIGDLDAAEAYVTEGLAMSEEVLGADHPRTASLLNTRGLLALRREDGVAAEQSFRRAHDIRTVVLGDDHRNTLNVRSGLAGALLLQGRAAEAEALSAEVVDRMESLGFVDPVIVGSARRTRGRALAALDRFEEAEAILLSTWEAQSGELGPDHAQSESTAIALVELYERWDRGAEAERWQARIPSVAAPTPRRRDRGETPDGYPVSD